MPPTDWSIFYDHPMDLLDNQNNHGSEAEQQATYPPPRNTQENPPITCRTDASWDKTTNKAGLAWIFTGPETGQHRQGTEAQNFVASPLMAEALAVRSALTMAASMDIPKLQVFSDSQTLIRAINHDRQDKETFGIITDIQQISSVFLSISFNFIPRTQNLQADSLAKETFRHFSSSSAIVSGLLLG